MKYRKLWILFPLTSSGEMNMSAKLIKNLQKLGFAENEANIYAALVAWAKQEQV
jgi:predicted DNA-binding transcriptional regulator